jgi:CheY-like chemotaxis protein
VLQGPAEVWVDGDETRLDQVIENLLDNAIKFSPEGADILLEVAAHEGWAELTVRDHGDGIPERDLPVLFEPFVQADRSLDRARGGLGLGLAMVKGIAELHGGQVAASSEGAGRGSCFTVRLPRIAAPAPAPVVCTPAAQPAIPSRVHVLLAEDNEDAADTMRLLLELSGFSVCIARSGPAAVETAYRERPHALVCDVGLPGCSGYEVARTLRSDPAFAGTLMIAVTGYGTADDHSAAMSAGFDRHFAKPVDPQQVFSELVQLGARGG